MADRRGIAVPLFIIAFILFAPDPHRIPPGQLDDRPSIQDVIEEEQRSLSVVQNSSWDPQFGDLDHRLNLTGLASDNGFAWDKLQQVKARAQDHVDWFQADVGNPPLGHGVEEIHGPLLYRNVTGYVHGRWIRSHLQKRIEIPQLNLSAFATPDLRGNVGPGQPFGRNITGDSGDIAIRFNEKGIADPKLGLGNITEMGVEMKISDEWDWEMELKGVYSADLGQAVLTTTSSKFAGIFALPHMTLSPEIFDATRSLLNNSINRVIQRQVDGRIESYNPWTSRSDGSIDEALAGPECDLVVWLQQLAPIKSTSHESSLWLSLMEKELRFPTGAFVPTAPDIRFAMLAFSPDCGYVIESDGPPWVNAFDGGNHLTGPKMEMQYRHGRQHLMAFNVAQAFQLWLFMRQMREASTPSTRGKISLYTIAMLALGDGFATMTFVSLSLFLTGLWTNLAGTGFIAFISVSFFGLKFLINIWAAQAPERIRQAREEVEEEQRRIATFNATMDRLRSERLARSGGNQPQGGQTATEEPRTDATAPQQPAEDTLPTSNVRPPIDTGATPVFFMPSDQEGLLPTQEPGTTTGEPSQAAIEARISSFGSLYTRFYLLLLATAFLSLNAVNWPKTPRRVFFTFLALIYLSFWIPQILRNVQRNCRHALNWEFVLGQSLLRLTPFVYFYAYEHNILFAEVDYFSLTLLVIWVWIQIVFLVSQEIIGPRWFIRKDWAPPAYDYHPILREDEEDATMPIGFAQTPGSPTLDRASRRASIPKNVKGKGKRVFDCAICMQELEVPIVEAGTSKNETSGLAGGLLARRMYMVTPCRHIFHSACLEGWMKFRLQCPICREDLPPL